MWSICYAGSTKNKYIDRALISEAIFRQEFMSFCEDTSATKIAKFVKISRTTINKSFMFVVEAKKC